MVQIWYNSTLIWCNVNLNHPQRAASMVATSIFLIAIEPKTNCIFCLFSRHIFSPPWWISPLYIILKLLMPLNLKSCGFWCQLLMAEIASCGFRLAFAAAPASLKIFYYKWRWWDTDIYPCRLQERTFGWIFQRSLPLNLRYPKHTNYRLADVVLFYRADFFQLRLLALCMAKFLTITQKSLPTFLRCELAPFVCQRNSRNIFLIGG